MSTALWILNILLALAFLAAGAMKLTRTREALVAGGMAWAADFEITTVKLIGAAQVVGAVGLVVPLATGIAPILTPLAAAGLALIMIGACVVHIRRHEPPFPAAALAVLAVASSVLGFLVVG